jgi:hypothetical protein
MKKYNTEDYFSVIENKTGRKICDCGEETDALMMVSFDPQNRTYTRNKFLMGPVVDIEVPKQLPTTNINKTNSNNVEYNNTLDELLLLKPDDRIPINVD